MRFRFFPSIFQYSSATRKKPSRIRRLSVELLEDRCLPSITLNPVPPSLASATVNSPYSQVFTAGGGNGSYTFTESGTLPVGLTLSSTGLLAGTPETAGSFPFTVTAKDGSGDTGSQIYTLKANLGFDLAPLPTGVVGVSYPNSTYITPAGGSGNYTFTETGSPSWLKFSSPTSGQLQLTGTPTQAGDFSFTVTAKDNSTGLSASQTFTLPVSLAVGPNGTLAAAPVGTPYSGTTFTASGGSGDYAFSASGTLPPGLSLSSTGQLTGTPTQAGSYSFTVAAVDRNNPALAGQQNYTLNIGLELQPGALKAATTGSLYTQNLTISGGSGVYNLTPSVGLPPGIVLQQAPVVKGDPYQQWQLSGTPSLSGVYSFSITATDADNSSLTATQAYTLYVNGLTVSPFPSPGLSPTTVGAIYSQTFSATGGTGGMYFSLARWENSSGQSGGGPSFGGLKLSTSGILAGTPTQAGLYTFTLDVRDGDGSGSLAAQQVYNLVVFAPPDPAPTSSGSLTLSPSSPTPGIPALLTATVSNATSQPITAAGGKVGDTYLFSETGALPPGMSFQSNGQLTGTPTQSGSFNFTVVAIDANDPSLTGSQEYTLTVANNGVPTTSTAGFQTTIAASSGGDPVTTGSIYVASIAGFSKAGGLLSVAVTNSKGKSEHDLVSYQSTATSSGNNYYFTGCKLVSGSKSDTLNTGGNVVSANQVLPASGGTIRVGSTRGFPTSNGQIVVQTTTGTALVSYTNTSGGIYFDGCSTTDSGTVPTDFLVSLSQPSSPLSLAPTILPQGTVGQSYLPFDGADFPNTPFYQITATGGTGPYKFSYTGMLPPGIYLSPTTGQLTDSTFTKAGKPTTAGTFAFTVTVTDSSTPKQKTASQAYSITILPSTPGLLSPQQVAQAYGINNIILSGGIKGDGAGQTIAILAGGDDPYFVSSTSASTTIASGSNGKPVTTETIYVQSTAGFSRSGGQFPVLTSNGTAVVQYTSTSGGVSFTGCKVVYGSKTGTLSTGGAAGFDASDLHQFDSYYGLPDPPSFLKLNAYGGSTNYPSVADVGETAQDVEWAHALAPAANIILLEGITSDPSIAKNFPGVTVVSNSYTGSSSNGSLYLAPAGTNFTFVTAAGDNNIENPVHGAPQPASSPYVLAAGMTELVTDSQGNYIGEGGNALADFGASKYQPQPAYQQGITSGTTTIANSVTLPTGTIDVTSTADFPWTGYLDIETAPGVTTLVKYSGLTDTSFLNCTGGTGTLQTGDSVTLSRSTPDVSFVGEANSRGNSGVARMVGGKWQNANGTSLATPAWAALIAIANQGRALTNQAALNGPTGTLPDLYNLPASDFNKITNLESGAASEGNSTSTYNQSGLGTPIANRLIPGLVGGSDTISGQVIAGQPQAGWTVFLSATPNAALTPQEANTTTDANGFYSFLVAPGTYYVNVIPPPGWNLPEKSSGPISFAPDGDAVQAANLVLNGSANLTYVDNLYQLLLHRNPDPGAAGWVNLLNAGTSPATVVQDIEQSPEYLNDLVNSLYQHYLNRPATGDPGAQGWVTDLEKGDTIEQVIAGIVSSPEFYHDAGGSNSGYINYLYYDILGRNPDTAGYNAWLNALGSQSRAAVATGFLTSTEYRQDLVAGVGWTSALPTANPPSNYFQGYYLTYLRRQGDPSGVAAWLAELQGGVIDQQVLAGILGSVEGYSKWS